MTIFKPSGEYKPTLSEQERIEKYGMQVAVASYDTQSKTTTYEDYKMTNAGDETIAVANKLLAAACKYKGTDIATIDTVAKEARPYWLALASAYQSTAECERGEKDGK
jgi:hypothetical protein